MAISAEIVTVSDEAVAINTAGSGGLTLLIANTEDTDGPSVDLGGADVEALAGFPLLAGQTITVRVAAGDTLYAIRSGGTDADLAILSS